MPELSRTSNTEPSEFGRGVVICLAKFSEHLCNRWAETAQTIRWWETATDRRRREDIQSASEHPQGDAARRMTMLGHTSLAQALQFWANGARDHFLELDRDRAPTALCALADLVLKMGNVYPQHSCTWDDWLRVHELWKDSCLELDALLDAANPDWGAW